MEPYERLVTFTESLSGFFQPAGLTPNDVIADLEALSSSPHTWADEGRVIDRHTNHGSSRERGAALHPSETRSASLAEYR